MRRMYSDDRTATDPHGFAPVPEAGIPRQRAGRPVHDPWDPAHDVGPADAGLEDDRRYPEAEYVPPRRARRRSAAQRARDEPRYDESRYDEPGHADEAWYDEPARAEPDGAPRYAAEDDRPRRRAARREADRRPRARGEAPARPRRSGTSSVPAPPEEDDGSGVRIAVVAVPVAVGSLVAVAIGVWARVQEPTGVAVNLAGFSSGGAVKTWLATLALVLALAQGWTGMVLGGRVGAGPTPLVATVHRWSGRLAVLVTVPVAIQCLVALGWSGASPRTLVHSLLGCVFYGAFVTKMLLLRRPGVPGWVVAVSGGVLLAVLTGIWLTSALWFFGTNGLAF